MNSTTHAEMERYKALMTKKLLHLLPEAGDYPAPFGGLCLYRKHDPTEHKPNIYWPVAIVMIQAQKSFKLGDAEQVVREGEYFVAGMDMPIASSMQRMSPEYPYLSLAFDLDKSLLAQMSAEAPPAPGAHGISSLGVMTGELDADLADAFYRLVKLIERPAEAAVLLPLISREIHYRLLTGPCGSQLRALCTFGTPGNQIARATAWLRQNYARPLVVDELARRINMAPSTFHKHFKEVTALSPLQYQKSLRLAEAQRLMLSEGHDAAQAGAAVGYESAAQFHREYKRLYGEAPRRDVVRLREYFGASG